MEDLGKECWDVVLDSTGLQQSLLALALSRTGKRILHLDPNEHYGGSEAALSLQEVDDWVEKHRPQEWTNLETASIRRAEVTRHDNGEVGEDGNNSSRLSFSRAYTLCLSPQIIYANSRLLKLLVSSRAYRQLEFLAVGSYYILRKDDTGNNSRLLRIPSTREDVFSSADISAKGKRQLMKVLKLVLSFDEPSDAPNELAEYADKPLATFLPDRFGLDKGLQEYIMALTLSLDGRLSTKDGLTTIRNHLTSMGIFGAGFAAVYPKWGGNSEIAQVACRAGAVGGGVYMLDTHMRDCLHWKKSLNDTPVCEVCKKTEGPDEDSAKPPREIEEGEHADVLSLYLSNGAKVRTRLLATQGASDNGEERQTLSKLVAVVDSPLTQLFETSPDAGGPTPAVAVICIPPKAASPEDEEQQYPVYVVAHSSDTGECPGGQCLLYFTTIYSPSSKELLQQSLQRLLDTLTHTSSETSWIKPKSLYELHYEQTTTPTTSNKLFSAPASKHLTCNFGAPSTTLAFDDSTLDAVEKAWEIIMGDEAKKDGAAQFMVFEDREGVGDDDQTPDF